MRIAYVFILLTLNALLTGCGNSPGGMRPNYKATNYDERLTLVANTATPVILALSKYHQEHSAYPTNIADLRSYLNKGASTNQPSAEWDYVLIEEGAGYSLSRKLGWDPTLNFKLIGTNGSWSFDPGDGSPETVILLAPQPQP